MITSIRLKIIIRIRFRIRIGVSVIIRIRTRSRVRGSESNQDQNEIFVVCNPDCIPSRVQPGVHQTLDTMCLSGAPPELAMSPATIRPLG